MSQWLFDAAAKGPMQIRQEQKDANRAAQDISDYRRETIAARQQKRRQDDLLFAEEFEAAKTKKETEKRKKFVSESLDAMEQARDAIRLGQISGQDDYTRKAIERLQEVNPDLVPLYQGVLKGDRKAAQQFGVLYQGVENDAFDLGLRERPKDAEPNWVAAKNRKTGAIEYADKNSKNFSANYEPAGDSIRPNMKPAIRNSDGAFVLADFNDPETADTHRPVDPKLEKDGKVVVDENGNPKLIDPTSAVDTQLQKDILAAEKQLKALDLIADTHSDEYLTTFGRMKASIGAALDKAGMDGDLVAFNAARTKFANAANQFFNQYRKEITGAVASEQEMQALLESIMNEKQGPHEFRASFDQFMEFAEANLKANKAAATNGISVGPRVVMTHPKFGDITPEDIGATMKANDWTRSQVMDWLKQ